MSTNGKPDARVTIPKNGTQKRVAMLLGVERSTVAKWWGGTVVNSHNSSAPDAKVKVDRNQYAIIYKRLQSGETT